MTLVGKATILAVGAAIFIGGAGVVAQQRALAGLGLTEAAAREFVLGDIKAPATDRRSAIAIAGTRAFLKLPPAARGPAATALFAWAKTYVNSPAFKASYTGFRNTLVEPPRVYPRTVQEEVQKQLDDQLAGMQQIKEAAARFPPAERDKMLENIRTQEANVRNPDTIKMLRAALQRERDEEQARSAASNSGTEAKYPADPQQLLARRLREFLDVTADADFSARTISLTGGPDGVELVEPADQKRSWIWQEAVIVGREATTAARAAADAWLKEIAR